MTLKFALIDTNREKQHRQNVQTAEGIIMLGTIGALHDYTRFNKPYLNLHNLHNLEEHFFQLPTFLLQIPPKIPGTEKPPPQKTPPKTPLSSLLKMLQTLDTIQTFLLPNLKEPYINQDHTITKTSSKRSQHKTNQHNQNSSQKI